MLLSTALKAHPQSLLHLEDGTCSYQELLVAAEALGSVPSPLVFTPEWSKSSLARIIAANTQNATVVLVPKGAQAPSQFPEQIKTGHVLLRTSGSEGPPKWVAHTWQALKPGLPIEAETKHLAAALLPAHAAGLEVLMGVFKSGIEFSVGDHWRQNKNAPFPDSVAGPPQHLGLWLAMASQQQERIQALQVYYCCADAFHPHWEAKRVSVAPHIKVVQVYGCSEAWQAPTQTHPQFPWLIRFTDNQWKVVQGKVVTTSSRLAKSWVMPDGKLQLLPHPYAPGDHAIEEKSGWWRLQSARHEVASFWGQKLNLLEIEARALVLAGVADATAVAKQDPLAGQVVELHIVLTDPTHEAAVRDEISKQTWPFPSEALVPVFGGSVPTGKKRRRL